MRQLAWLHATPKPPAGSRRAQLAEKAGVKPISRMEQLKGNSAPLLPPNLMPHVVDRLLEIGLVETGGMTASPLSWREIEAFKSSSGIDLPGWEARLIHRLSTEYVAEGRRAEAESCPAPWADMMIAGACNDEEAQHDAAFG